MSQSDSSQLSVCMSSRRIDWLEMFFFFFFYIDTALYDNRRFSIDSISACCFFFDLFYFYYEKERLSFRSASRRKRGYTFCQSSTPRCWATPCTGPTAMRAATDSSTGRSMSATRPTITERKYCKITVSAALFFFHLFPATHPAPTTFSEQICPRRKPHQSHLSSALDEQIAKEGRGQDF